MPNISDSRQDALAFLYSRVDAAHHSQIRETLLDAISEVERYEDPRPIATLERTVKACEAILSGEAAKLSRKLRMSEGKFREGRSSLNSKAVDAYIKLRYQNDIINGITNSEWTGPRAETLRRGGPASRYLSAMRDAQKSAGSRRRSNSQRQIEEIVSQLKHEEDRQLIRQEIASGSLAKRRFSILKNSVAKANPTVDLDNLESYDAKHRQESSASNSAQLVPAMISLKNRLQDNDQLRHFGLETDGKRLKTTSGQHVIPMEEYETLIEILDQAINR